MGEDDLATIEARCAKADEMVERLCRGRDEAGHRDWLMSIPARPDHDPDLVIAAALADVPALVAEVRRLRAELAARPAARLFNRATYDELGEGEW